MAPPHTPSKGQIRSTELHSPTKDKDSRRHHPGPLPINIMTRSVKSSRSHPHISSVASLVEAQDVTSFVSSSQQESQSSTFSSFQNDSDEEEKIRVSYTREQKLAAITYFLTTTKPDKHNVMKPIIKYEAAKNLRITSIMLRK